MQITREDIGKWFNLADDTVAEVVLVESYESAIKWTSKRGGRGSYIALVDNESGECREDGDFSITSRHEPRSWLKDMPNLGDIKEGWIACDKGRTWYWYDKAPVSKGETWICANDTQYQILSHAFNLPALTSDQWKESLISTAELNRWQSGNKQASQA